MLGKRAYLLAFSYRQTLDFSSVEIRERILIP